MPSAVFFDDEAKAGAVRQRGHRPMSGRPKPADARPEVDPGRPLIDEENAWAAASAAQEVVEIFVRI